VPRTPVEWRYGRGRLARLTCAYGEDAGWRPLATSSFSGLVNGFFSSMAALIPGSNLGISAAILAVFCLSSTVRLHRSVGGAP
jgi:hypothetical protein